MKRNISATNTVTTTSATDITVPQLTSTIPNGVYFVIASVNMSSSSMSNVVQIVLNIYSNNIIIFGSERQQIISGNGIQSVTTFATVVLDSPTVVEARTRSINGTLTMIDRSIQYIRLAN